MNNPTAEAILKKHLDATMDTLREDHAEMFNLFVNDRMGKAIIAAMNEFAATHRPEEGEGLEPTPPAGDEWKNAVEPTQCKAGDQRVLVNGYPLTIDFRIVAENKWCFLQASLTAEREKVERLEAALQEITYDPYPEDLFKPIPAEQWRLIHEMLKGNFSISIDRLSAEYGRLFRKPLQEKAKEALKQLKQKEEM